MKKLAVLLVVILAAISIYAKSSDNKNKELYDSVGDWNIKKVEKLLSEGADVNTNAGGNGWTPLMKAVLGKSSKERIEMVEFLLKQGADVKAVNKSKGTALHIASMTGTRTEEVEILIKAGADVNAQNENGTTPLHNAVFMNNKAVVEILLKNNANINAQNKKGETPLIIAAQDKKSLPIVEILLEAKADPSIKNNKGETALILAKRKVLSDIIDALVRAGGK